MYTMGDNSIFKKSQEAKNKTDEAIKMSKKYMNSIDNMVNEYLNETGNGESNQARGSSNRKYKKQIGQQSKK